MKIQLLWEKLLHGTNAFLGLKTKYKFSPALSKRIAIYKMKDVIIISDEFNGETVLFEPLAWVILESYGKLNFFGAYYSCEDIDETTDREKLPKICIRNVIWHQIREREILKSFKENSNIGEYIFGENHVKSEIIFIKDYPIALELVKKGFKIMNNKLNLEKTKNKPNLSALKIYISNERVGHELSYSPYDWTEPTIENWVNDWISLLNSIDKSKTIISDNRLRISYRESLLDYIKELAPGYLIEHD